MFWARTLRFNFHHFIRSELRKWVGGPLFCLTATAAATVAPSEDELLNLCPAVCFSGRPRNGINHGWRKVVVPWLYVRATTICSPPDGPLLWAKPVLGATPISGPPFGLARSLASRWARRHNGRRSPVVVVVVIMRRPVDSASPGD